MADTRTKTKDGDMLPLVMQQASIFTGLPIEWLQARLHAVILCGHGDSDTLVFSTYFKDLIGMSGLNVLMAQAFVFLLKVARSEWLPVVGCGDWNICPSEDALIACLFIAHVTIASTGLPTCFPSSKESDFCRRLR